MILENKMVHKLKLSKDYFYKNCAPQLLFLIEKNNQKKSDDSRLRKLSLKVRFGHFLKNCHGMNSKSTVVFFEYVDF